MKASTSIVCFTMASVLVGEVSANVLEETVVTATRREVNLQDTGISVSAFTGAELDRSRGDWWPGCLYCWWR